MATTFDNVFGITWRSLFVAWMASKVADSMCNYLGTSHWTSLGVVAALVIFAVVLRGPLRKKRSSEQCSKCGKLHGPLSTSLGPRVDSILRVEGLVASVLILMSWCEHCEWNTDHAYAYSAAIAFAVALGTVALSGCHKCPECHSQHFTIAGRRPTVTWGPK